MTASNQVERIIKRMADLLDVYKLVKLVDKTAKEEEKNYPPLHGGGHIIGSPSRIKIQIAFIKRRLWRDRNTRRVEIVIGLSCLQYIKPLKKSEEGIQYNALQVTNDGQKLLERSFFHLLPKGLLLAWVQKNSTLFNLLIGFVGGVVAVISVLIALHQREHH